MMVDAVLEWSGALVSLAGAFLLALNTRASPFGWVVFLVANVLLIAFAVVIGRNGLLLMQTGFLFNSAFGLWRSGLLKRWRIQPIQVQRRKA